MPVKTLPGGKPAPQPNLVPNSPQSLLGVAPPSKNPLATPPPPQNTPKPKRSLPADPPIAPLQQVGFNHGGIQEFNNRVQQAADAYQKAHGQPPSAGLTLDVVRSQVDPGDYNKLFNPVYSNPTLARLAGATNQDQKDHPYNWMVTRPDGITQPRTPFYDMIYKSVQSGPNPLNEPQRTFLKQYPMTPMGILPIPSFDKLVHVAGLLDKPEMAPQIPTTLGGKPVMSQQSAQAEQMAEFMQTTGAVNDFQKVTTYRQAQVELNKAMGTNLPVTGLFNQTWMSAIQNWQKTTDYARQSLKYTADQLHLTIPQYVAAWKNQKKASSHGLTGQIASALPIQLFTNGSDWLDILKSTPTYIVGGSNNPLNIGLHSLTRTAGLSLDAVGGTVNQGLAYLNAGSLAALEIGQMAKTHKTYEQIIQDVRARLHQNPSWVRILYPHFAEPGSPKWEQQVNQAVNVIAPLILLRKPEFTGGFVEPGDLKGALGDSYLQASSDWSYKDLALYGKDGIGRASARLESGQGARALVARAAKGIQRGDITPEQWHQHVAEMLANGQTTLMIGGKEVNIQGPLLDSLRSKKVPSPGVPGRAWLQTKSGFRNWLDRYDVNARSGGAQLAPNMVSSLRSAVSHYVPPRLHYFDKILPERTFNFILKHQLTDAGEANRIESALVRFQGQENVRGIQQVQRRIEQLYHAKYPIGEGGMPSDDPFKAVLSTEAPSVFHFPGGGEKELQAGLSAVQDNATKLNKTLNKLAALHGKIILSGFNLAGVAGGAAVGAAVGGVPGAIVGGAIAGPLALGGFSLFWKHAVGDTLRAEIGGGGILTGLSPDVIKAKRRLDELAATDPEASRILGAYMNREVKSEAHYNLNKGGNTLERSFNTGDKFDQANYMTAAGAKLRGMIDDPAFRIVADGGGQDELTQLVLHDKTYRGMWKSARAKNKDLTAEDYADLIHERYKSLSDSLAAQHLTLNDAWAELNRNRGAHADKALGKFIKDNKVDFKVDNGQVEQIGKFDSLLGKWVGNVIMAPNKFNRGRFAHNVLAQTFADLTKAGWDDKTALQTSASLGGELTKYHMLDFANRLQVEQNLRWISYFATKHRLYFKWVLGTFLRTPRYAAATYAFKQTLDQYGGWSLPLKVAGSNWDVPLERLVWVPGREYDETSPLGLAVLNGIKSGGNLDSVVKGAVGTSGNVVTRSDTATLLGTKLLKMNIGKLAPSYANATNGLDSSTVSRVNRALNEYQIEYQKTHGHYDTEEDAVKKVLLAQMGEEYWRANLPLPLVPEQSKGNEQELLAQFMALDAPAARSKFLNAHPGFSDNFGVYTNPATYLHNRQYFQRWTKAIDAYRAGRAELFKQAQTTGHWTEAMEKERRALTANLNLVHNNLLIEDAQQSGVKTGGMVPDGSNVPFGVWGKVANKDPFFDTAHALNTMMPKLHAVSGVDNIGPITRAMQQSLAKLDDPAYVKALGLTPSELRTERDALISKLAVYNAYPSDALGKVREEYQTKYVNNYWTQYNQKYNAIQAMASGGDQRAADQAFRAWRDSQNQPVKINGISFPPPLQMAWAMLDPATRQQRLSYLASKPLGDLADYELDLLGVHHPSYVSAGLNAIEQAATQARDQGQKVGKAQLLAMAKQVDKVPAYHGFYAYYANTLSEPRVRQFESTSIFRNMPEPARQSWAYISGAAKAFSRDMTVGHKTYYSGKWRQVVKNQIMPWLDEPSNKPLKDYLAPMGANFLNELVSSPVVG